MISITYIYLSVAKICWSKEKVQKIVEKIILL